MRVKKEENMTVYVIQEMGRNIRSAEKFGDLKVLLPDNRQIVLSSGPISFKLRQELKTFNDDDYLLLIGDPAIIAVAAAVAANVNNGRFKVLKWDRDDKAYYDIEIDLNPTRIKSTSRVDSNDREVLFVEEIIKEK
jgi:hypothetical protein|tara:strand:- start:391 stop:798 length:408 start_codon:yes stop_codon:yes gene_type:complete